MIDIAKASAIRTRFRDLIQDPEGIIVEYDNGPPLDPRPEGQDPASPTTGIKAPWVRFSIRDGSEQPIEMGNASGSGLRFRAVGIAYAQIFTPADTGDSAARVLARKIVDAFRQENADGIQYRDVSLTSVGTSGAYYQLNVSIAFQVDEVG